VRSSRTRDFKAAAGLAVALFASVAAVSSMVATSPAAESTTITTTSPVSVSFLPSGEGWTLSGYHCTTGICIKVARTLNEGRSWTTLLLPSRLREVVNHTVSNYFPLVEQSIYFADAKNGWIYGSGQSGTSSTGAYTPPDAELWSTHDGGRTWSDLRAKSLGMKFNVLAISASRGTVFAVGWLTGQSFGLWRSSAATDSWRRLRTPSLLAAAGGSNMEGAVILKGASGWLMVGNDRGVTGSARLTRSGHWVTWNAPCDSVGGSFAVPVATSATTLVDVCTIGGYGMYLPPGTPHYLKLEANWIFVSHDGGLTFAPTWRVVAGGSSKWLDQLPSLPASPAPGVVLVARSVSRGSLLSDHLYLTRNGGRTWSSVYATPSRSYGNAVQYVTFASSRLGCAIVLISPTRSTLIITTDGGRTWHRSTA